LAIGKQALNPPLSGITVPLFADAPARKAAGSGHVRFAADPAPKKPKQNSWDKAHDEAVSQGKYNYKDPDTGYNVWTELYLKARGTCCKSGCRHCPYGFTKP
jgi:hypothetical protein